MPLETLLCWGLDLLIEELDKRKYGASKQPEAEAVEVEPKPEPEPELGAERQKSEAAPGSESPKEPVGEPADVVLRSTTSTPSRDTAGRGGRGNDYIPVATRRAVRTRDGEGCSFVDERGVRCGSTWRLEFHHVVSPRLGGDNSPDNVRIYCRRHNQWQARAELGDERFAAARQRSRHVRTSTKPPA